MEAILLLVVIPYMVIGGAMAVCVLINLLLKYIARNLT